MIIDLSQYNTITSWDEIKKSVDGVIFRLGYRGYGNSGNLVLDKCFHKYLSECTNRNIPYGIYFVTQAVSSGEGREEAAFIKSYSDILNPSLGIWLDSEWSAHPRQQGRGDLISKAVRTDSINAFLDELQDSGFKSGIYTGDYWIKDKLIYEKIVCGHWWLSRYGKNNGKPDRMPEHPCELWQYTSKGRVSGIRGDVDLSEPIVKKTLPIITGYTGHSIIEALKQAGYDSSFAARKKYAELLGIVSYKGTAEQNLLMIKLLS